MNRCAKCVLPSSYPGVHLDCDGVCDYCRSYSPSVDDWVQKKEKLDRILEIARSRELPYDVLLPWSGGKDSTYALYQMKVVYGLKTLAINFDNGFQSQEAKDNIQRIADRLGVDVIFLKPNTNLMMKMYRVMLENRHELCTVCNMSGYVFILSFARRYAAAFNGSPLIVGGWSRVHEEQPHLDNLSYGQFTEVLSSVPDLLHEFESNPLVDRGVCDALRNVGDPRINEAVEPKESGFIQLPDYLEWNPKQIASEICRLDIGYRNPEYAATHFDCIAHPVMKAISRRRFGFDQDTVTNSAMIRMGQMSRDQALAYEGALQLNEENFFRRVSEKLKKKITANDFS